MGGSMCSPRRFGNSLKCASLRRMHEYRNLPYNLLCQGAYPWCPSRVGSQVWDWKPPVSPSVHCSRRSSWGRTWTESSCCAGWGESSWMKTLHTNQADRQQNYRVMLDEGSPFGWKKCTQFKLIGNRIIILCWMRGIIVDKNTAHTSSW
jgi:hypothetical protein